MRKRQARYCVFMSPELKRGLQALKARDGISDSEPIGRAVAEFLKKRRISITQLKGPARKPA
jgi:hypothetical protein